MNAKVTPVFETEQELADFIAIFNRPPYSPAAALAKAQAVFPEGFNPDSHWLAFALILVNGGLEWMLRYMDWKQRIIDVEKIESYYGILSGGEEVLTVLALHLLNSHNKLWSDGLVNLRRLGDWHFELAMHAIRLHTQSVRQEADRE